LIRKSITPITPLLAGTGVTLVVFACSKLFAYSDKPWMPTIWDRLLSPGYWLAFHLRLGGNFGSAAICLPLALDIVMYSVAAFVKTSVGALAIGLVLTAAFWISSANSEAFNDARIVLHFRALVFSVLVKMGMNPHQPSDLVATVAIFLFFSALAFLMILVVNLLRGRVAHTTTSSDDTH
jgi:hypothetical protein